jgi:hypothetical protein
VGFRWHFALYDLRSAKFYYISVSIQTDLKPAPTWITVGVQR